MSCVFAWNRPWQWFCKHQWHHVLARYEPCINHNLIYRHMVDYCINCKPLYCCIIFIFLMEAFLIFIGNSKKMLLLFYKRSLKIAILHEIMSRTVRLTSILYWIWKELRTIPLPRKSKRMKIQNIYIICCDLF